MPPPDMSPRTSTSVRTLGIDLASQPQDTAAVLIDWSSNPPRVVPLTEVLGKGRKLVDSTLVELILRDDISRVAIDAPFGWPQEFVDALASWRDHGDWPVATYDSDKDPAKEDQGQLVLRATDREIHRVTGLPLDPDQAVRRGKWPLSVSTDKIAFAAMRCIRILAEVSRQGEAVDRSGGGRIVEVYPDAALREWNLRPPEWDEARHPLGYKGRKDEHRERRQVLLNSLAEGVGDWLVADRDFAARCVESDDELDALVAALLAEVVNCGGSQPVGEPDRAKREGWIHLPQRDSLKLLAT